MKQFTHFLNEEKKFAKALDQDFTVDDSFVVVFNEKDSYKQSTDKTHDSVSHAIKHLAEFKPDVMRSTMSKVKETVESFYKQNPNSFIGIKNKSGSVVLEGSNVLSKMTLYMLGNTLDLINDKFLSRGMLSPLEKDLHRRYAMEINKEYLSIIKQKISHAVDLDKTAGDDILSTVQSSNVIKFNGWQKTAVEIVLDFKDNSIIICTPDYIRTLFQFDRPASSKKEVLANFFSKRIEIDDKRIAGVLKSFS